jgi:hypothetical protein
MWPGETMKRLLNNRIVLPVDPNKDNGGKYGVDALHWHSTMGLQPFQTEVEIDGNDGIHFGRT